MFKKFSIYLYNIINHYAQKYITIIIYIYALLIYYNNIMKQYLDTIQDLYNTLPKTKMIPHPSINNYALVLSL